MDRKLAATLFLALCLLLAVLLLANGISTLASGAIFAAALILLGGLSRGFHNEHRL